MKVSTLLVAMVVCAAVAQAVITIPVKKMDSLNSMRRKLGLQTIDMEPEKYMGEFKDEAGKAVPGALSSIFEISHFRSLNSF